MPIIADIYYHKSTQGSGSHLPVTLIHGAGGSHLYWPPEIRRLPDFRIYAIDLPGHGKSPGHGLQDIQAYAEAILSWMEALGLHRSVFVGHSMGGAVALTLAKTYHEKVLGLILISTGARLRVSPDFMENIRNTQNFLMTISKIISKSFSTHAKTRLLELAQMRMEQVRPSVLYGDFLACNNFDIMDSLSSIKVPTLVICGQEDEMTPLRYSQYLSDNISASELKVIPDAGHMVMLEQSHQVARTITEFLSGIPFHPGLI